MNTINKDEYEVYILPENDANPKLFRWTGSTNDLYKRMSYHRTEARKHCEKNELKHNWIIEHLNNNTFPTPIVVASGLTKKQARDLEAALTDLLGNVYDKTGTLYNKKAGNKQTKEIAQKISASNLNTYRNEDAKEHSRNGQRIRRDREMQSNVMVDTKKTAQWIKEELDYNKITQRQLCTLTETSERLLSELKNEHIKSLTQAMYKKLIDNGINVQCLN